MQSNSDLAASTLKTARFIYYGIAVQATLFVLWGQEFFISVGTPAAGGTSIYFVFCILAILSFFYGIRFFQNYTRARKAELDKHSGKKLKETLLVITAMHFLLLEFIAVIGILLAIFVQNKMVIVPFYFLFAVGLAKSLPRAEWYAPFFKGSHG